MEKVKEITQKAKIQAKDAIHGGDSTTHGGAHNTHSTSTNAGPHDSNLGNKADPRVDSDLDGSRNAGAAHTGTTHGTHHTGTTHGTHHTGATHGQHHTAGGIGGAGYAGNTSTNAGPHDSNLANKADPRVDSDLDGSRNLGANTTHGTHHTGTTHGAHHTGGGIGGAGYAGNTSTNAGPHDSNLANKADPRIDSDLDGSRNLGGAGAYTGTHTGTTHTGTTHGTHHAGNVGNPQSTNAGPHGSNFLNKADPRVDSDLDGSRNAGAKSHTTTHAGGAGAGYGGAHTGATHTGAVHTGDGYGNTNTYGNTSTNAGPHDSNLANKADPRVDSDLDGSRNAGAAHTGGVHTGGAHTGTHTGTTHTGTTGHNTTGSTNAGPHSSNLLNKLDPRVDSDRDGSRNAGAAY